MQCHRPRQQRISCDRPSILILSLQVEGEQFVGAIAEALEPRMRLSGEMNNLEKFKVGHIAQWTRLRVVGGSPSSGHKGHLNSVACFWLISCAHVWPFQCTLVRRRLCDCIRSQAARAQLY